jgi:SAM-dependent methyltransferase
VGGGAGHDLDWAEHAGRLGAAARDEAGWYGGLAVALVRPADRLVMDVGCGGGGMAVALAAALPAGAEVVAVDGTEEVLAEARAHAAAVGAAVRFARVDIAADPAGLAAAAGGPADLVWASAVVHHAPDQQAAVDRLAALLGPGGRLVLAEGGLRARHLPWDVGVGEPGLEVRLEAAQDRWFGGMRAGLPGTVPMPYGWPEALRRAGLVDVLTRSTLLERPAPLSPADRAAVVASLRWRVDRMRESGGLADADGPAWERLLDPAAPAYLGDRPDVFHLEARSVHLGHRPA